MDNAVMLTNIYVWVIFSFTLFNSAITIYFVTIFFKQDTLWF